MMPDRPDEHLGLRRSAVKAEVGQVTSLGLHLVAKGSTCVVSVTTPIARWEVARWLQSDRTTA